MTWRAPRKALRTVPPTRNQGTVMHDFWDRGLYSKLRVHSQIQMSSLRWFTWPLLRLTTSAVDKESSCWCWQKLPFGWVGIPADAVVWVMPSPGEEARGQRKLFMPHFSLSRHRARVSFHINVHRCCCSLTRRRRPPESAGNLSSSPALCSTCCRTDGQPGFLLPPCVSRAGAAGTLQFTCAGNHILSFAVLPKIFLGIQWSVDSKMFLNTFVLSDKSSKD